MQEVQAVDEYLFHLQPSRFCKLILITVFLASQLSIWCACLHLALKILFCCISSVCFYINYHLHAKFSSNYSITKVYYKVSSNIWRLITQNNRVIARGKLAGNSVCSHYLHVIRVKGLVTTSSVFIWQDSVKKTQFHTIHSILSGFTA